MRHRPAKPLRRRAAVRAPLRKFTIFCEGKNTEPYYFRALHLFLRTALIEIEVLGAIGTPYTIAQAAKSRQQKAGLSSRRRLGLDSFEQNDEIWAVFDRDEHPRFQEAIDLCLQSGIGVARSNPCFEVWLILHFEKFERPDDRHRVQKRLEALCPDYSADRGKKADFSKFMDAIDAAERKAEVQLEAREAEGVPFGAPSTTVFRLTRSIRQTLEEFSKK